jgi:hypothetical protein
MAKSTDLSNLVEDFVQKLTNALHEETETRAREAVMSAFGGGSAAPRVVPKAKKTSNPRLQLAGRYMGLIRKMKKGEQKQIKGVRATQGVEAAIELMNQITAAR